MSLKSLFILCLIFLLSISLYPQALIGTRSYDIQLTTPEKEELTVTFFPDVSNKHHFHYVPIKPRLAIQKDGAPLFQFVKYNLAGEKDKVEQGGILLFGVTLELPKEMLEQARQDLAKKINADAKNVSVGMIELSQCQISLLATDKNNIVTRILGNAEGVVHPGSVVPFMLELSTIGAQIYEELVQGTAGIAVNVHYKYKGLTPIVDCRITGTWDKAYNYYSTENKATLSVRHWMFGGSASVDYKKVKEDLVENTDIKILWKNKPDESKPEGQRLVKYIEENVMDKITKAVFDVTAPVADEKPTEAVVGTTTGAFGGLNYGLAIKDVQKRKKGSISFSYIGQSTIEVAAVTGNFMNISGFGEDVKKRMFTEVKPDDFFNTLQIYCTAPINPKPFGIIEVKHTFRFGKTVKERTFVANKNTMDCVGNDVNDPVQFAVGKSTDKIMYRVEITSQLGTKNVTVQGIEQELARNGYMSVGFNLEKCGIDSIYLDFTNVKFYAEAKDEKEEGTDIKLEDCPKFIAIKLVHGKRQFVLKGNPDNKDDELVWLIARDENPVTCSIFGTFSKSPLHRAYVRNAESDLKKGESGRELIITNADFQSK